MPAPGSDCAIELVNAVKEGKIPEAALDQRIQELLTTLLPIYETVKISKKTFDAEENSNLARRCAEGSIVLLENDGILPLKSGEKVAIVGDFAQTPRYQGAGSSLVNPTKVVNLLDCAKEAGLTVTAFAKGFSRTDPNPNDALIAEAVAAARTADIVLLCVGLDEIAESEGLDRESLELSQGQRKLIQAVTQVNRNAVLVLSGGAPFIMPTAGTYRAAIHGYLSGQMGAAAMVNALIGKINPSGKLNESWPLRLEDTPSFFHFPSKERTAEYREGLYVGYRYYDTAEVPVRYPFGHGLSYTTFTYSDLEASPSGATFTVTNTGSRDGAEAAQVYVSCKNGVVFRPKKELKGFIKVFLKAGEKKTVTVPLDDKAFRYFNVALDRWEVENADYEISVASSVRDVRLTAAVSVKGDLAPSPYEFLPSYECGKIQNVSDGEFSALLGHPIPDGKWIGQLGRNDALCQMYYARSGLARLVCRTMTRIKEKADARGVPDLNILFLYNMPFRAICKMSGDMVSSKMVDDILLIVNGHFWRGAGRLCRDFFRNRKSCKAFRKELEG